MELKTFKKEELKMKKSFVKVLPFAAAVLLATSCSKDDNNDETKIDNQPKVEKVVIPFSVKVNTDNSLSKIAYTVKDNDVSQFDVTFTNADEGTEMNIESGGNIEPTTLILVQEGNDFVFKGDITLAEGITEDDFNSGFNISGSFGEAGEIVVTSTTSLADVMGKCSHQYTSTFSSKDATINLDDNYAYLEVSCATEQTKFQLTIGGSAQDYIPSTTNHKIWIAVPNGTSVTGNMIKSMTVDGGNVYRADRTDVVDLGPTFSVLWTLKNLGANSPTAAGLYYTWGETNGYASGTHNFNTTVSGENFQDAAASLGTDYRMPNDADFNGLNGCRRTWVEDKGCTYSNDYGSIFFPAAGYCGADAALTYNKTNAYYWVSTYDNNNNTYKQYRFETTKFSTESKVVEGANSAGFPIRAVRQLNN
jgi:hypothetical protein